MKQFVQIIPIFSKFVFFIFIFSACSSLEKSSKHFNLVKTLSPLKGLVIHHYRHHSNGLDVYLIPGHAKKAVAMVTAYDVGSRDEEVGKTGLAHLFEHMMFRGTESFPDPFKTLASWGGEFNAYTSQDQTVYYQNVTSDTLQEVIKFEAERMRKLMITPEIFNTERGAVVSERKLTTEDKPIGRLFWTLYQTAFDKHTYKFTPIGRQEDIDRVSFDEALDFYKKHYAPNTASIALTGDFSLRQALSWMDQYYGSFQSEKRRIAQPVPEKLVRPMRRKVVRLKTENAMFADAIFAPPIASKAAVPEFLYCVLLANSDVGYLRYELVEKGIASSVGASCFPSKDPNLSIIFIRGNSGVSVEQLEAAYVKAVKGFEKWLTQERIDKIKVYFTADKWSSMRSPMNLAKQTATMAELVGDPLYHFNFNDQVMAINREDIVRRIRERSKLGKTRVLIKASSKSDSFE